MKGKRKFKPVMLVLYCCAAALLCAGFWMVRLYQKWGWEPLEQPDFVQSSGFGSQFLRDTQTLESLLDQLLRYPSQESWDALNNWGQNSVQNFRYSIRISSWDSGDEWIYNGQNLESEGQKADAPVYYRCLLNTAPETNIPAMEDYWFHVMQVGNQVDVTIWIDDFSQEDAYRQSKDSYDFYARLAWPILGLGILTALIFLILLLWAARREGRKASRPESLYVEEEFLLLAASGCLLPPILLWQNGLWLALYLCLLLAPACWLCLSAFRQLFSLRRYGGGSCFLTVRLFQASWSRKLGAILGLCLYLAAVGGVQRWYGFYFYGGSLPFLLSLYALLGSLALRGLRLRLDQDRLLQAMAAAGSAKTGSEVFLKSPCFRPLERQLQKMSQQVQRMVEQNLRGERLKVDLITNVSHDLKTPLTSMITYIRLMQRESGLPEKDVQYLQVLSEKSLQLKRLTEDLLDAAKITSGNETAAPERLDFGELVRQANGEFAEALETKQLELISQLPEELPAAWIDGQKTWRILSNLYGNICKYALPGTRVYVDITVQEAGITLCLKNISQAPLNLPPEELMERFVQGDTSRSSGGNGLGLAIARDLAKLQGGKLELEIVGDLFLARLTVPTAPAIS